MILDISDNLLEQIKENYDGPTYIYFQETMEKNAKKFLNIPNDYGLTIRYAAKAAPNKNILKVFDNMGLHFDSGSGYEAQRIIDAGISPKKIEVTSQEFPHNINYLVSKGVKFNASSLYQLEKFGKLFPGENLGVRINPGLGSGGTNRTNVGGPGASFGIWYEYIEKIKEIAIKYNLFIYRIHTHIGSGADPKIWSKVAEMSLDIVKKFSDVEILNLGGGFKIDRMNPENSADIKNIGEQLCSAFQEFYKQTGRKLKLELEPGSYLVGNSAILVTKVDDIVDTGKDGYTFLKLDSGMTELTRPSLYGAQHPIYVFNNNTETKNYIVTGHCCESGDIFTPAEDDPEGLLPRNLNEAKIGDFVAVGGVGAYCSSMSTINYNSFPRASEYLLTKDNKLRLIRERQKLEDIYKDETDIIK